MSDSTLPSADAHPDDASQEPAAPAKPELDVAAALKQRFPGLFAVAPKPLKLRIQADIQERAPGVFSKQQLSAFLRRYTGATSYLIATSKAQHRFDLDGQAAGELSEEHREVARQELARRRERSRERQAADEAQQRARAELLRAFETTTLTRSNFCALKGVAPEALDALLDQARQEREAWQKQRAQMPGGRPDAGRPGAPRRPDGERRPQGRPGGRGPAPRDARKGPPAARPQGQKGGGKPGQRPQPSADTPTVPAASAGDEAAPKA